MKTYTSNEGMFGESFAVGDGYQATYVPERTVSMGFRLLCECAPHMVSDHIVYGRLLGGGYVGVGQPYPVDGEDLCEAVQYFKLIGMRTLFMTGLVWSEHCMRIHFFKDDKLSERFNIAINCARWHNTHNFTCELITSRVNLAIGSIAAADEDDCGLLIH